jgi:hypothetical protein
MVDLCPQIIAPVGRKCNPRGAEFCLSAFCAIITAVPAGRTIRFQHGTGNRLRRKRIGGEELGLPGSEQERFDLEARVMVH